MATFLLVTIKSRLMTAGRPLERKAMRFMVNTDFNFCFLPPFTFKRVLMCAIYMTPCARHKGSTVRFPNGMKAVGDFLKKQGVRFGIYSDEGTQTCGGFPGSEGYEKLDADTFASWGVDYLKLVRREKGDGEEEWSIIASIVSHPLPF